MRPLLPFLCLLSVWTRGAGASDPDLPFMEYLDPNHLVCLKWGFDDLKGNITFKLVVNTTGWVGIGFSEDGGMTGADIVMGGVGPSGHYFSVSQQMLTTARGAVGLMHISLNITGKKMSFCFFSLLSRKLSTMQQSEGCVFVPIRITTPQGNSCLWWTSGRATLSSL